MWYVIKFLSQDFNINEVNVFAQSQAKALEIFEDSYVFETFISIEPCE